MEIQRKKLLKKLLSYVKETYSGGDSLRTWRKFAMTFLQPCTPL